MIVSRSPWALPLALAAISPACVDPQFRDLPEAGASGEAGAAADAGSGDGCTEAECAAGDGGANGSPSDVGASASGDGGAEADGSTLALPLPKGLSLGRYATRIYSFTVDGFAAARGVGYSYMDIKRRGSDIVLSEHYCSFTGAWALFLEVKASFTYPVGFPPREVTVHEGSDGWYTSDTRYAVGYTLDVPDTCTTPGATVTAPASHWNRGGVCTCPLRADDPPTSASDCRVTDPDGDAKPGLSVRVDIAGAPSVFRVVQENQDRYLQGRSVSSDRMVARYLSDAKGEVLECVPSEPCTFGNPVPCPPESNLAELVRIPDDWTCTEVIAQRDDLFPVPPPQYAENCAL